MSITANFTHSFEDGLEAYSFASDLHPDQRHFVQRTDETPWTICLVDTEPDLTLEQGLTLIAELERLCDFLVKLKDRELRRSTEPGAPAFEEGI